MLSGVFFFLVPVSGQSILKRKLANRFFKDGVTFNNCVLDNINNELNLPPEVLTATEKARDDALPLKSKKKYE